MLHGILPAQYFKHYTQLVNGILLLSSEVITVPDLNAAEALLKSFYTEFSQLYGKLIYIGIFALIFLLPGEKRTTMNIHFPSHLSECVRQWGPLWAYTCFQYENMNGHLWETFHGTRNMSKQVFT